MATSSHGSTRFKPGLCGSSPLRPGLPKAVKEEVLPTPILGFLRGICAEPWLRGISRFNKLFSEDDAPVVNHNI